MRLEIASFYQNKTVFVTGHTGFKGAWLCLMLKHLGAKVIGYALSPDEGQDIFFSGAKVATDMTSNIGDIRDYETLQTAIIDAQPDIIFHLAAQPLVRASYVDPIGNYATNIMGTVHVLEVARTLTSLKAVVNITTDKCYENNEWVWPYRETDALGGHDPYSASKACSEIVTASYRRSFYEDKGIGLASARAGNVIGGGDFSTDRIIPDIIRSFGRKETVALRNPHAVRPWQHVLDVLQGYLILGHHVYQNPKGFSEAFNFSPLDQAVVPVEDLTKRFIAVMGRGAYTIDPKAAYVHEAQMLRLDPSKAVQVLGWTPHHDTNGAIEATAAWYKAFLNNPTDIKPLCQQTIHDFIHHQQ
jgi:CDP-glucose 4,6-dehydratase